MTNLPEVSGWRWLLAFAVATAISLLWIGAMVLLVVLVLRVVL